MEDNPSSIDEPASSSTPRPVKPAVGAAASIVSWRQGLSFGAVANLAHELRTSVQVLLGYGDILRNDHGPVSTETHALLDRMDANVHDLAQTLDNLMHFVMREVNAGAMIDEDVTPGSLVAEITPVLEAANQKKQLKLELDFAAAPDLFRIPVRPLKAILLNLALNAIKFTDWGLVTIVLRRHDGAAAAPAIEVEVTDTGPGLSPEALSEAKEPFAQLSDSSTRRYRGLGLGLAVVQQSIDALGGQMVLRSHVGSGSKFLVTIPIRVRENSVRASMARRAQLPMIPQGSTSQEPSDALLPDEFSQRARS
jgi:signal transduction histidine kinase